MLNINTTTNTTALRAAFCESLHQLLTISPEDIAAAEQYYTGMGDAGETSEAASVHVIADKYFAQDPANPSRQALLQFGNAMKKRTQGPFAESSSAMLKDEKVMTRIHRFEQNTSEIRSSDLNPEQRVAALTKAVRTLLASHDQPGSLFSRTFAPLEGKLVDFLAFQSPEASAPSNCFSALPR